MHERNREHNLKNHVSTKYLNLNLKSLKLVYFITIFTVHIIVELHAVFWLLTCNGTADLAPTRTNTGAVPYHPVLWSLVSFTDPV